ncbi:hypothetical protein DFQ14_12224 [Halopolyspora algeriensis]|uniref:Uncharacterized protein n=1 Tax=Halopolyspora algeriensis TaxID=1500506 RepID=A0A368VHJ8_9ACTN|nr:hypothetical protein [Halopolyspora algeriensis]RCW38481.1 hypothetical protein DFQ14_12224 [Halopolyspora algeriensis]TQM42638.1 hypothetical protein FHU43_4277 [Halopolyspora algeriensis]
MPSTVTMPVERYRAMKADAELGRMWREWHARMLAADSAHDIAEAERWGHIARQPSFAELQRLRGDTAARPGPNPLDELFPRPRPLSDAEQRRASLMLDAALGATRHDETMEGAA